VIRRWLHLVLGWYLVRSLERLEDHYQLGVLPDRADLGDL